MRSTFDILQDLAGAWDTLTSVEKQELAETVAGKTQRSLFTAIMTNFESAVGATEAALNSEGSAAAENEKRMDSLQGKTQQLQAAWQDFARNTINSELVKSILSLGTTILNFANSDMGRFILVLGTATTAVGLLKKALTADNLLKFASGFNSLTKAVAAGTTAFQLASATGGTFRASMIAAGAGVEVLTKSLLASPLFGVVAAGMAIWGIIEAINVLMPKMEDLSKATEESTAAYEEQKQKTEQIRNELDSLNTEITELEKKGTLTFTDEKELENLKEQKKELEDSLTIAEKLEKAKKEAAAIDIAEELQHVSNNPFEFFNVDDAERSIEDAKKILKDAGDDLADILGGDGENIRRETQDMASAYVHLADEITKQKERMAQGDTISDEDQEKLEEMEKVYSELGGHLAENAEKFQEWSETLEGGGEEAEKTKGIVDTLLDTIDKALDTTEDVTEATEEAGESMNVYEEDIQKTTDAFNAQSEALDTAQKSYDVLKSAIDEYNNSGYLSIDTLQSLLALDDEHLAMLSLENGQLALNTTSIDQMTDSLIAQRVSQLQASAAQDLYNLALGNTERLSSVAKNAIANAGTSAETTGNQFSSAVPKIAEFTAALNEAKKAAGDATAGGQENFEADAQKIISSYQNIFSGITALGGSTTKAGGTSGSGHRYTGSSSGRKSSGGSGKKSSSKSAKEEYKPEVDALYWYKNALDNAEESVDKLNDALKNTDNFNEQEKYLNQLIEATNNQINKTNDLKNAQVGQINDFINQLRQQGFAIDYNSQSNELYINNMQHLSDFTGDAAKNIEKLIDKIQDLNDDNRDLDSSVRDLTSDVKDYYDQLAEIPEKKLEKFNDLMEEFQQSRLDQVQYQIEDLEHEMENDPRLKALEEQIEALEKQNDELDKQEEMEEKLLAVEEAKLKLQNAQQQKTLQVYREGQGFVWEVDPDAIKEAQEELEDAQKDLNEQIKDDQLEQLEAEKEAIEKSYQDRIDALEKFLDEQEYIIDKANREGIQTFEELRSELAKYGLDSAEYLGKATEWLNNYNSALANLNNTVQGVLASSGDATSELIYSSAMQSRINQALSSVLPEVAANSNMFGSGVNYDKVSNSNSQTVYINTVELPNVQDSEDFISELKNLPRMATSQSALRK